MRKGERSNGLFTFWFVCETVIHSMCYGYFLSILGGIYEKNYPSIIFRSNDFCHAFLLHCCV